MSLSVAARAAQPTARAMAWGPLVAAAGAITGVAASLRPWDGHPLSLSMVRVAVGLAAAAAAFGLDDGAGGTIAASPTTLGRRQATRMVLVVAAVTVVAGGACLVLATVAGTSELPASRVLLESSGMVLAAAGCAVVLGGDRGAPVFAGGLLAAVVVQQRFPDHALFPFGPGDPAWDRAGTAWLAIALAGALALAVRSRDPVGRRLVGRWHVRSPAVPLDGEAPRHPRV